MVGRDDSAAEARADQRDLSSTPTNSDIEKALRESAVAPASASNDAGSVTQQDISKLIELDRYGASKAATKRRDRGLRVQRIIPPGTV